MLAIIRTDDEIERLARLNLTKYAAREIRAAAQAYNEAYTMHAQKAQKAREIAAPFIGQWGYLPGAPEWAKKIDSHRMFNHPMCRVGTGRKSSELFPISVWEKGTRKLMAEVKRLEKLIASATR